MIFQILFIVLGFLLLFTFVFIVKQQTAVIIETFGRFTSVRNAGIQFKIPFIQRKAGIITLKIQQLDVIVETKTKTTFL